MYYHNYPLTLTVQPGDDGKVPEQYYWLVNGIRVDTEELLLNDSYTEDTLGYTAGYRIERKQGERL